MPLLTKSNRYNLDSTVDIIPNGPGLMLILDNIPIIVVNSDPL